MPGNVKKILVYNDEGVSSVDILIKSLNSALNTVLEKENYNLIIVSAHDLKCLQTFDGAVLLIIPGGRDLPYVEKLNGDGTLNIQKFVCNGGAYLGICAGAYFGSEFCDFEKGTDMEVCGERFLKFFPGIASGCVFPGFEYGTENASQIVDVKISKEFMNCFSSTEEENVFPCYYNGGCEFISFNNTNTTNNVEIIAKYNDMSNKNAIVLSKVGMGKALLSGVHPEMYYEHLDTSKFSGHEEKLDLLKKSSQKQQALFHGLMKIILQESSSKT
eukprot:gene11251-12431_t